MRPFYARFMKELPTVEKLAVAEEEKLLKTVGRIGILQSGQKYAEGRTTDHG